MEKRKEKRGRKFCERVIGVCPPAQSVGAETTCYYFLFLHIRCRSDEKGGKLVSSLLCTVVTGNRDFSSDSYWEGNGSAGRLPSLGAKELGKKDRTGLLFSYYDQKIDHFSG